MDPLLEVCDLSVGYGWNREKALLAVRDVDLTILPGEVLGIAGESGCGKSTLAMAVTGLLEAPGHVASGAIKYRGTDLTAISTEELRQLRLTEISVVFQASMNALNPVMKIVDQFHDAMAAHGVQSAEERRRLALEAFELVKIPARFLDAYPHQLSGGMRQRAMIALAIVMRPKLLVLDEPTTALDVVVQRSIIHSLDELRRELGFAVVFITHDLSLLVEIADRILIMYAGSIVEEAPAVELYQEPNHPYTRALMSAFPPLGDTRRREGLAGSPPDLRDLPPGCPFAPRCPDAIEECAAIVPRARRSNDRHVAVCHFAPGKSNQ